MEEYLYNRINETEIKIIRKDKKASVNINLEGIAYISDLLVDESCRKKGFGGSILKEAERIIKMSNKKSSQLLVLKHSWMKNWYERVGYVCTNSNEDFCEMIKKL